ncbi:hypothetical protein [Candidatus Nitrosocosmicus sp. T]|jgi:hypothetical protein
MSNITKTHKVGLFAMFIAAALIGSIVTFGDNMAFATKKSSNESEQEIEQEQSNEQNAQCVSGDFTIAGCNNVGLMFQLQDGNIAAGQQ